MNDALGAAKAQCAATQDEVNAATAQLEQVKAALESWSRTEAAVREENWHPRALSRIELPDGAQEQMKEVRAILPHLDPRLRSALCKAIWEVFYREGLRQVEIAQGVSERRSGIYAILVEGERQEESIEDALKNGDIAQFSGTVTHDGNDSLQGAQHIVAPQVSPNLRLGGMASPDVALPQLPMEVVSRLYVGQSVDIGARWYQHAKRALGVEEATRGKLYPAMKCVEKCHWMVLELCREDELSAKEKWWIEALGTDKWGLNSKKGG